ncbi:MAG: glycosyltransferase [Gammaproteobacteria bacterium]|nr:glycosyltransferase [Gammaproteobacteria bacterium]
MNHPDPAPIALLLPSLAAGGVGRSILDLARGFQDLGHPVELVLCRAEGPYREMVPAGVRVVALHPEGGLAARLRLARLDAGGRGVLARPALLPLRPAPVQPYVRDLARYLTAARPAALLAAKTPTNLLALWARRLAGAPTRVVVSERTQLSQSIARSRKWRWRHIAPLVAHTYPWADGIAAVSDGVADDLAATTGLSRTAITTVYNPVVTPELPARAAAPPPHPWLADGGPPVIVGAGRLAPQKRFPLLLQAFARLRAGREARLVILGEGPERGRLEALVRELGIAVDVALPGFVENPYAAFARASLFVLSSDYEGLPGVLIQALACGCPVVSTDCPSGPAEILEGGRYGELVPVGDAAALAAAMARTLEAPLTADTLRRRGGDFSQARSARGYLNLLLPGAPLEGRRRVSAAAAVNDRAMGPTTGETSP